MSVSNRLRELSTTGRTQTIRTVVLSCQANGCNRAKAPPLRRGTEPAEDPPRCREPGDDRGARRHLDRQPREPHRDEQERALRALRLEGTAAARDAPPGPRDSHTGP